MGVFDFFQSNNIESDKLYKAFNVEPCISDIMKDNIKLWGKIYSGQAPWLSENITIYDIVNNTGKNLKTMSMAKIISSEISRLTLLGIEIDISGNKYIQYMCDKIIRKLTSKLEYGIALGTIIFKPINDDIDIITPMDFIPISWDSNGDIASCIFTDKIIKNNDIYIRAEYHNFTYDKYTIENKAFLSKNNSYDMKEINLDAIPEWSKINPIIELSNIDRPLFSTFKMPNANDIDMYSPMGVSCFSESIPQLEDIDISYTRIADEIDMSKKILFLSQFAIDENESLSSRTWNRQLPNFVRGLEFGTDDTNTIYEHNPKLQTEDRKKGLNLLLSILCYQCGFSNGYFNFNEKTGMVTATQIEADQQRTVQTILSIRKNLQTAIENLFKSCEEYSKIYNIDNNINSYELSFYFKDITSNFEEDRKRNIELVKSNILPKWKYLTEYEGYTEEEAKALVKDANEDGGSQRQDDWGNQKEQLFIENEPNKNEPKENEQQENKKE